MAEYHIYIVGPVAASALLKIDVDLALLARKTKQAPLAGARRKPRCRQKHKAPRVDDKLAA
jgi:hypothetical protein